MMSYDQTLEINPNHSMILKLNLLRKKDPKKASMVSKQLLDNVLLASGVPHDLQSGAERNLKVLDDYLQLKVDRINSNKM